MKLIKNYFPDGLRYELSSYWENCWLGKRWYEFTCWAWKRHTTVKPRWIGHTWYDRSDLLPYVMFEVLCQFVEKELGNVEWNSTPEHKHAYQEIMFLYDWWNKEYLKKEEAWDSIWNKYVEPFEPYAMSIEKDGRWIYEPQFHTEHDKKRYSEGMNKLTELETIMEHALTENCIRLVKIKDYMWT